MLLQHTQDIRHNSCITSLIFFYIITTVKRKEMPSLILVLICCRMGRKAMPRQWSMGRPTAFGRQRRRSGGSGPAERRRWHAAAGLDKLQSMFPARNTRLDEEIGQRQRSRRRGDSLTYIYSLYTVWPKRVAKEPRISRRIIGRNSPMLLE